MSYTYTKVLILWGDVSLGHGTSDDISINGLITSDILPRTNSGDAFNLGSLSRPFNNVYSKELYVTGDVTLGNSSSDDVTFGGRVGSHVLPISNNVYDLGSSSRRWANLYIEGINASGDCIIGGGSSNDSIGFYGKNPITRARANEFRVNTPFEPTVENISRLSTSIANLFVALDNLGLIDHVID